MVISETWRLFKSEFSELLLAVLASGMLFTMGYVAVLAAIDITEFSSDLKRESTLEVFFEDGVSGEQVDSVKALISAREGVLEIREKSPDEALSEMSSILGSDLTEVLGFNPLPLSLEVSFHPEAYETNDLDSLSTDLVRLDAVMEVHFASEWIENLKRLTTLTLVVSVVICSMILLGAIFVFASLQRHIYAKRVGVIHNLMLLGMKPAVIRSSALVLSIVAGVLSSAFALAITAVLWKLAIRYVAVFPFFDTGNLVLICMVPVLIAIISSLMTQRRFRPGSAERFDA